jgi:protein SCO1/2
MNKKALYGILLTVFVPLIAYFSLKRSTEQIVQMPRFYFPDSVITVKKAGKQYQDTVWHKVPDFTLTNQLGQQVSFRDLEGKVVVADFFFTHCPTICPEMTTNMKELQNGIKSQEKVGNREANFIHFLSFSIDPERDSVQQLKKWADRFQINPQNWWLLTGDKKKIYDLSINEMKLGLVDGKNVDTAFFHTDYFVLIDKKRQIRGYYHGRDTAELSRLSTDIILLQLEKDPNRKSLLSGKFELLGVIFLIAAVLVLLLVTILKRQNKSS